MGIRIRCILEVNVPGVPRIDGKSLAEAYCGESRAGVAEGADVPADIIAIDFGGGKSQAPSPSGSAPAESLFAPLDPFIAGDPGAEWHDAAIGLAAVRSVLKKLRDGATVSIAPDFEFGGDEVELSEAVRYELEELEQTLIAAEKAGSRFHLAFDL
jgi:hypothetical protein